MLKSHISHMISFVFPEVKESRAETLAFKVLQAVFISASVSTADCTEDCSGWRDLSRRGLGHQEETQNLKKIRVRGPKNRALC